MSRRGGRGRPNPNKQAQPRQQQALKQGQQQGEQQAQQNPRQKSPNQSRQQPRQQKQSQQKPKPNHTSRGPQGRRDHAPQPKKPKSVFDLKTDASETVDIQTSGKVFRLPPPSKEASSDNKRYGILFFETFAEANLQLSQIEQNAKDFDQLNIVVHQEGSMYNTPLNQYGKLFAGEAWWLVHKRREAEGWYNARV